MPNQDNLDALQRWAMLKVWGGQCVWCHRSIGYHELEIDHLVAKSLKGNALAKVLSDYNLPPSFDLRAIENLVPSCKPCNSNKGPRPLPGSPIIMTRVQKAAEHAKTIRKRVGERARKRDLSAAIVYIEAIRANPTPAERDSLTALWRALDPKASSSQMSAALYHGEPEPTALRRSNGRLGRGKRGDVGVMEGLLLDWAARDPSAALDVVSDTFDSDDSRVIHASPSNTNFLAYARHVGDYLANVAFSVEYLYSAEYGTSPADTTHDCDLWITLDSSNSAVIRVVPDYFHMLDLCPGYR